MGTCVRCQVNFTNWVEYHNHKATNTCYLKIVPLKTSNKTTAQIVSDVETRLGHINFYGLAPKAKPAPTKNMTEDAYLQFMRKLHKGGSNG